MEAARQCILRRAHVGKTEPNRVFSTGLQSRLALFGTSRGYRAQAGHWTYIRKVVVSCANRAHSDTTAGATRRCTAHDSGRENHDAWNRHCRNRLHADCPARYRAGIAPGGIGGRSARSVDVHRSARRRAATGQRRFLQYPESSVRSIEQTDTVRQNAQRHQWHRHGDGSRPLHARYPALQATRLPLMDQPADSYSLATVIGQSRVTFSFGPGRTACLSGIQMGRASR